jgi:hypothetical protein
LRAVFLSPAIPGRAANASASTIAAPARIRFDLKRM